MPRIDFLVPGDIDTQTGGYAYDRRLAAGLRRAGWDVGFPSLAENLDSGDARARAAAVIRDFPDGARVLIDGLALAPLAQDIAAHAPRLRLSAVVHHPAGLETGLSADTAAKIAQREAAALRVMHSIVCTSRWTARRLLDDGQAPARIHVVEPGVEPPGSGAEWIRNRREPLAAHGAGLRLLCVATLTPRKGHDILIRALARLSDLNWRLECIGSKQRAPQHRELVEALIDEHGLHERVQLRGEVSQSELALAYASCDLFVLASRLEGYGMVLAEARAAGLPIVASRGGAVAETLACGHAVVLVEPDSPAELAAALRCVLDDPQAWLRLSSAANRDAGVARSWDAVTLEFLAALELQTNE